MNNKKSFYFDPLTENFLVEYRGNFKEEIDKISYAAGDIISSTLAVVSFLPEDRERLLKDVPSIVYIDFRMMVVLQNISPTYVDNINNIKINPYLNLDGYGVTIGIVDTGIDYLNEEFIWEDGTSRILKIWDQSVESDSGDSSDVFIGKVYTNEQINSAIKAYKNNENPYTIVPTKDERGHGTKIAGIIGGRGITSEFQGISHKCNFIIVKLMESTNFKAMLKDNLIDDVPVYNTSECVAGLEFLKKEFFKLKNKAMVICTSVGSTEGSHDGRNLISRYLNSLAVIRGLCLVTGVGNEGDAQGHVTGYIKSKNDISTQELKIPRPIKNLRFNIWIAKPNSASVEITSPTGESSQIIKSKINKVEKYKFIFTSTEITVSYRLPDNFTGSNVISIEFKNLKTGLWKIKLIGEYIIGGRYDIWLPPHITLPTGLIFMESNTTTTITLPATAQNTVSVAYYGENGVILSASGKGWDFNIGRFKPDIATIGINILTTKPGGGITTLSGSSAATAITAGVCALLLQWGILKNNDSSMYSNKIRSYLIYGTLRNQNYKYPNKDLGYGELNLLGTFNSLAKIYNNQIQLQTLMSMRSDSNIVDTDYIEYSIHNLFIRIPINT